MFRTVARLCMAAVLLVACGAAGSDGRQVTVCAASSLTEAFTEIGAAYEADHPASKVTQDFAASSALASQILEGAPCDVLAAADEASMQLLRDNQQLAAESAVFATNALQIITTAGNPLGIGSLADLSDPGMTVVLADPTVPLGAYTATVLANAGVSVSAKSLEQNAKAVAGKVAVGEADAGVVYVTDVLAAGDSVDGVEVPADVNIVAKYPIAVTRRGSGNHDAASFVEFVLSSAGQRILEAHGFGSTVGS